MRVLNNLDQDQDRHSFGPDLGPYCLQTISRDDKSYRKQVKFYLIMAINF